MLRQQGTRALEILSDSESSPVKSQKQAQKGQDKHNGIDHASKHMKGRQPGQKKLAQLREATPAKAEKRPSVGGKENINPKGAKVAQRPTRTKIRRQSPPLRELEQICNVPKTGTYPAPTSFNDLSSRHKSHNQWDKLGTSAKVGPAVHQPEGRTHARLMKVCEVLVSSNLLLFKVILSAYCCM